VTTLQTRFTAEARAGLVEFVGIDEDVLVDLYWSDLEAHFHETLTALRLSDWKVNPQWTPETARFAEVLLSERDRVAEKMRQLEAPS
jgi:hypothetical protein